MNATKLEITLSQSQLRENALVRSGLSPKAMSMRRGMQVQKDRKHAAKLGRVKHKARAFD